MANKQWIRDRFPILLKEGYWGFCKWCGKPKKKRGNKFCSRGCAGEHTRSKSPEALRKCLVCSKIFRVNPAYLKRRKNAGLYCSRKCFFNFIRGKMNNPGIRNWWSKEIRERDNFKCKRCGIYDEHIHTHHIASRARRPDLKLDLNNGMCLCISCHAWVHSHPIEAEKQGYLKASGYIERDNMGDPKNKKIKRSKAEWQGEHKCVKCKAMTRQLICDVCGNISIK